jgi:hypothetical protein
MILWKLTMCLRSIQAEANEEMMVGTLEGGAERERQRGPSDKLVMRR